ncbi:MAG: peptidoglycan DD-metalloendopeptidase family protein, partial [Verrucomicrobiae bacterium]|nr:peptidoglycan DD-metalloendopeptidase family protein [Verrucomicrobiae bacterium]
MNRAAAGTVLALALGLGALTAPAQTVLFRLPLSSDTAVHYYYDHDTTSGIQDWKCGTATYNGHRGTDFSGGPRGRPIYAGAVGTRGYKIDGFGDGWPGNTDGGGFGNYVRLDHTGNYRSYYAHMNAGTVTAKAVGSSIACGEQIGGVGTSGNSSGLHLHFEVRYNNVADDPYAGPCGGPVSWWVNQGSGSPSTNCQGAVLIPPAPTGLVATPISASQINLTWTDNATNETGFAVERATWPGGPWTQIGGAASNVTAFASTGLANSSTYFFRVRAYNTAGDSPYSNVAGATTSNAAPTLAPIANQVVNEGATLHIPCSATDASLGVTTVLTDFENFASGTANGSVLFRQPSYSGTTSGFLNASPNVSTVTDTFPAGVAGARVLNVNWSFASNAVNPWLRLTTYNPANLPNPTVSFEQRLRLDFRTDRSLKVAVGLRETGSTAELGADGGTTGAIEFAGASGKTNNTPFPIRTIPANTWTNLDFNLPDEPLVGLTGNGLLESPTGRGVLEHLALVPNDGPGAYNVYLDNLAQTLSHRLTFSLDAGAPPGATIHPTNGTFTWTPTEAQGPGVYNLTVRVTDNGSPPLSHTRTFTVTVNEVNQPPSLAPIPDRTVNAGAT